jgi:NAD(P)-dependent dehydrogenase (short-subunit alcohol dehydrogenase family)
VFDLTGRVAVVIGGTSGIGRAIALALAEAGANVVPTGRREEETRAAVAAIEAIGRRSCFAATDVTDRASVEALHANVMRSFGRADILVNAAGVTQRTSLLTCTDEDWSRIVETNLTGTFRGCRTFARTMVDAGYGRIVNIASLASSVAFHGVAPYAAAKAGVVMLTKTIAVELSRFGVTANAIAPGVFLTDLNRDFLNGSGRGQEILMRTPMGRFGNIEELAGAAVFLASEESSFVSGEVLAVDGGFLASGVNQ